MGEDPAMTSAVPDVVPHEPPRAPASRPVASPSPSPAAAAPPSAQQPRIAPARVRARLARLVGSRLVATDLHSTNGTVLRTSSGTRRLRAGESIVVLPGATLDLGDDTIIEILSAQGAPGA